MSPLAGLTQLEELRLGANQISNLKPLAGLTQLTHLSLTENNISDVSSLVRLVVSLGLRRTQHILWYPRRHKTGKMTCAASIKACLKSKNSVKYYRYFLKAGEHRSNPRSQNSTLHYTPRLHLSACQLLVGVRLDYAWRRESDAGLTLLQCRYHYSHLIRHRVALTSVTSRPHPQPCGIACHLYLHLSRCGTRWGR
ncbi:leucine-rich repeat domain-containing protein [Candidatus Poribacteria bacterium]|nr:leucine-rich repeat domain-containing protein [Candidatus Poribacteria bacterium]